MRATLVHNPSAGDGEHALDELLATLRAAGLAPVACASDAQELEAALADPGGLVVVAGGDGTVGRVLAGLPRRDVPVAVVPAGTANNIARSFGIEGGARELAAGWSGGVALRRRELRVGVARGPWGARRFVEGVGFGALARAAAEADAKPAPSIERMAHARARIRRILAEAQPADLRLELDGRELAGPLLLVEVLVTRLVGPCLRLAPAADPADASFDVVAVTPAERDAMVAWLEGDGDEHRPLPPARRLRAARVRAAWRGAPLHLDDDFPDHAAGECELELEPEPITLLVPGGGAAS